MIGMLKVQEGNPASAVGGGVYSRHQLGKELGFQSHWRVGREPCKGGISYLMTGHMHLDRNNSEGSRWRQEGPGGGLCLFQVRGGLAIRTGREGEVTTPE